MTVHFPGEDRPSEDTAQATFGPTGAAIDLAALAERVFRLIKRDARLERERRGRPSAWRRKVHHGQ